MSISDEITRLKNAKNAIKTSIEAKGVTVSDTAKLDEYSTLIDSIPTSGSSTSDNYWANYMDIKLNNTKASYLFGYLNPTGYETECVNKIENIDTSNFTDISFILFGFNSQFPSATIDSLDVSNWDISNVRHSSFTSAFANIEVGTFNMKNWVFPDNADLYSLFANSDITKIDITGTDFSNVKSINSTFRRISNLTEIVGEIDCSNLSNGVYSASYYNPFDSDKKLSKLYLKNIYKDITITDNDKYSINLGQTIVCDECLVYIINQLPNLITDKGLTTVTKITLTLPATNTLTEEQVKVATDKGWLVKNTTY